MSVEIKMRMHTQNNWNNSSQVYEHNSYEKVCYFRV